MARESFVQRFMRITGKARSVFGPAQTSSLDHPMTEENQASLKARRTEASRWETVRRADGSTYLVPRRDGGQPWPPGNPGRQR